MIVTALNQDNFYLEQLLVLLTSINVNSPTEKVFVFLINFDMELELKLKRCFNNVIFENRNINLGKNPAGTMVCYRGSVIKECLEYTKKPVAWFDTDIIVRGDLSTFWKRVKTNQLQIRYRGNNVKTKVRFNAGVFAIGYSEQTLRFISKWNEVIIRKNIWYEDQLQLYLIYKEFSNDIELIKMSQSFNDMGDSTNMDVFRDNSLIWHCKKSHFYNKKFRKEYLMYLKKARCIINV